MLLLGACTKLQPGQVKVEGGIIQGTVTEDLTIYKGIPFAAPPVGDLRWKAPSLLKNGRA
jgi:para-nitrobenzyl esterase